MQIVLTSWSNTTDNNLNACGKLARSNEQTNQETNSCKHALISICPVQLRLNSCAAQCKTYEFQQGEAEYEITIKVLANYTHIPDGVFLVMMQGTREQQEMQPVNHHVVCTNKFL